MKKRLTRGLALLLTAALLFGMVPVAAPAMAAEYDAPHFTSGSYSCKEDEEVTLWLDSGLPTLSCEWSFSDPDAMEITAELSNLSDVSIYNGTVSYTTMLQLKALKAGVHTITANITTTAGACSVSATVTVGGNLQMTDFPESVKCMVGELYDLSFESLTSLGGVDEVNVRFSDEEAAVVDNISVLGGGQNPDTGEQIPNYYLIQIIGQKPGDYTLAVDLVFGSEVFTYETKLHVMENVRSGVFEALSSSSGVRIDGTWLTVAQDVAMGEKIPELTASDEQTVFYSLNTDGEVNKIYMPEDLCYPAVSLSAEPTALTYTNGRWSPNTMEVTATLRWKRKASAPFTEESLKRLSLSLEVEQLRLSISSDAMNFYTTGMLSKAVTLTSFYDVLVYFGSSRSETVTLWVTDGYVPAAAMENVYITAEVKSEWSDQAYTCAPVCVTMGNHDRQVEQAEEKKAVRQAERAAELLEQIQLMQDRSVLLYDGAMAQWFTEEQYENINNFLLLYMGWLLAVEEETVPDQLLDVQWEYIQKRLQKILGIDTAYQYLMDNILGFEVDTINSEILVQALNKDGREVFITFKVSMPSYSGSGGTFGALGSIQYSISGPKPSGAYTNQGTRGLTYLNFEAFAELVLDYIGSAYNAAWGASADKVATMLVSESVELVTGGFYADRIFTLGRASATKSIKKYCIRCPVDVYVYDMSGALVGAVVDNEIQEGSGEVVLAVCDDEKYVYLSGDTYSLKLVGSEEGTMDYTVEEYSDYQLDRTVEVLDVPLKDGSVYTALAPERPDLEQEVYSLEAEDGTVIQPDSDTAERSFGETLTVVDSGSCGTGVNWTRYSNGLLEIYGSGAMDDYDTNTAKPPYMSEDIEYVLIREGVTSIGVCAFSEYVSDDKITWNQNIKVISVPDSVSYIGDYAFYKCPNLQEVYLGSGVSDFGIEVFWLDENLTAITVSEDNPYYSSVDGVLYSNDGTILCEAPNGGVENWEIPQGVTTIEPYAVRNHQTLTSVTIPASVTRIGSGAFSGCSKLTEIHFEGDCPSAFGDAFAGVTATVYIPEGNNTWTLDKRRDYGGTLTWPEGEPPEEELIQASGTWGDALEWSLNNSGELRISGTGDMEEFEEYSWDYPWSGYQSSVTSLIIESGVTSIAKNAFEDMVYLTDVSIGDTVEVIGEQAFFGCEKLKSVVLPYSVTQVQMDAFEDCFLLTSVTVLNPDCAIAWFYNDETLGVLGVAKVHGCADSAALKLAEVAGYKFTAHTFTDGLCTICGCSESLYPEEISGVCGRNLTWELSEDGVLTVRGQGEMYEYKYSPWHVHEGQVVSLVIEPGMTVISESGFNGLWNLASVELPDTVKEIGYAAFKFCSSLQTITIPDSVERIGGCTFWYCDALETVQLGASVESIGSDAFENCSNLRGIHVDENNPYFDSDEEGVLYSKDRTVLLKVPSAREGSFCVPQGVQTIGDYALESCTRLTSVAVAQSVTSIGECAFYDCASMTAVQLPDSLTSIGKSAFSSCESLLKIDLPEGIQEMPHSLLGDCSSLTRVGIPDSVTTLDWYVFDQCYSLSSITIPAGVVSIGMDAFRDCTALSQVTFQGDAPAMDDDVFECVTATVYYPAGNATWTADVMQDYGGTLTWVAACDAHTWVDGVCTLCGASEPAEPSEPAGISVAITAQPVDYVGMVGDIASFTVTAKGDGLTYQWYYYDTAASAWKTASNGTEATLNVEFKAYRNNQQYRCEITDMLGNTVTSDAVRLTAREMELIITAPPIDCEGAVNEELIINLEAIGNGLVYEWFYSADGGATWLKTYTPGYDTDALRPTLRAYRDGYQYKCVITDIFGNVVETDPVTMTISSSDVVITSQPTGVVNGIFNQLYSFTVKAEGENLTYLWEYSDDGGATWQQSWNEGYNTATLKVRLYANRDENLYRCVVTSGQKVSVISTAVILDMQDASAVINGQPERVYAVTGETAVFHVDAEGMDLTYAWYRSNDDGATWVQTYMTGFNTDTLTFAANANRAAIYKCKITDGSGSVVWSDNAKLTILSAKLAITAQPESITCATGETAVFTVAAQGDSLKYQWYASSDGGNTWSLTYLDGSNTNSLSFAVNASRVAKLYKCIITDVSGSTVETDAVSVTIG